MNIKLQNILLQMANDVLDLPKTNDLIGKPIDDATQAIQDLLDKSLPGSKPFEKGYNQALADVRKVIKEK
jgi:hypothetical protein